MTERCHHCKQEVALPLRGLGNIPVCGVCAMQRIWLVVINIEVFDQAIKACMDANKR